MYMYMIFGIKLLLLCTSCIMIRKNDRNLFRPLISMSVIPQSEAMQVHLLAVTKAGTIHCPFILPVSKQVFNLLSL